MKTFIIIASAIGLSLIIVVVAALAKTSAWWSRWEEDQDDYQGGL